LRYVVAQAPDLHVEKVHREVANVDGKIAVLYRLKGEDACQKVASIAELGVTFSDLIDNIEVDCKDGQKKVFKKQ
uniref:HMA domain-containing protein n=1 Tax=Steinernema glaseri TaxID=37863 RepID=A0A1I7XWV6_9BILA